MPFVPLLPAVVLRRALSSDLLMLVWPIFFVAASRQDPHLKPRNFKKSVAKGLEGLRIGELVTAGTRKDGSSNPEDEEQKPHWERKGRQVRFVAALVVYWSATLVRGAFSGVYCRRFLASRGSSSSCDRSEDPTTQVIGSSFGS